MQVWVVVYNPTTFNEDLYNRALALVDLGSQARIKKFYRREDACRCLIGRLLPRMMLGERNVHLREMVFATTEAGKPYITSPIMSPAIAYNVSHDNALVAMAFGPGKHEPPAYRIGVDVMRARLPQRETYINFVKMFDDQLTHLERRILRDVPEEEGTRRFFWMWTMKEGYTKALGLGLGFDFKRIEYNVPEGVVTIDGKIPRGWKVVRFELKENEDLYLGVAVEFIGGEETLTILTPETDWVRKYDGTLFVQRAVEELN